MSYSEHSIREYESDSIQYAGIICLPIMPACLMEACTLHSKVSMTCVITYIASSLQQNYIVHQGMLLLG